MNIQQIRQDLSFTAGYSGIQTPLPVDWAWLAALLSAVVVVGAASLQPWVDPADLLRDPLAVAELKGPACCKVYDGLVSNLGVILWMACAAICIFSGGLLAADRQFVAGYGKFLLAAGLFSGFLGFDDLFLVHENVLPAFGIPQPITYGAYGLLALAYIAASWQLILENRFWMLIGAIALLGSSVTIDWIFHSDSAWRIIVEDGAKFSGICLWTMFHATAAWSALSMRAGRS